VVQICFWWVVRGAAFAVSRSLLRWWVQSRWSVSGVGCGWHYVGSDSARNGPLLIVSPTMSCWLVFCSHVDGQNRRHSLKDVSVLLLFWCW
jgi:hypothetical protein